MNNELFDEIQEYLKNTTEKPQLLTEDDVQTLVMALALKRQEEGFAENEVIALVRWAERQIIGKELLSLLLKGYIWVDDPKGGFKEDSIVIGLTELGLSTRES